MKSITGTAGYNHNQWISGIDSSLQWQTSEQRGHFSDPNNLIGVFSNDSRDRLLAHQLLHHSLLTTGIGLVSINNELHADRFSLSDELVGTTLDASRYSASSSVGSEWFFNDQLTLAGTVRHLWYQDISDDLSQSNHQFGLQLGSRADFDNKIIQLNAQTSHRAPSLIERFGNLGTFEGNDELESEKALSVDTSIQMSANSKRLSTSLFYRYATDAIAPVYNAQGIGRYINLDSAHYLGLEWQGTMRINPFTLSSSGSWQEGVSLSALSVYNRKRVPGFYPISTHQLLEWQVKENTKFRFKYLFESGLFYDRANSTQAPDKHQIDASISQKIKQFTVTFDAKNLTNQNHLDYSKKTQPGLSYVLSLEYTLGKQP
jgi:hypothetical protein